MILKEEKARPEAPAAPPLRLNKYLSEQAGISRRAGDRLVKQGKAFVNGKRADSPGLPVYKKDRVTLCNKALPPPSAFGKGPLLCFAFNKPAKILTSASDPKNRPLVMDFFKKAAGGARRSGRRLGGGRLFPVGRLDWDSEGLLLITNDGDFAQKILHPSEKIPKTYLVKIQGAFPPKAAARLKKGIRTALGEKRALFAAPVTSKRGMKRGRKTKAKNSFAAADGRRAGEGGRTGWVKIIIAEGKNRQVRAMLQAAGLSVLRLKRTAVGRLQLGALPKGGRRLLLEKDLAKIFQKPKELCGKKKKDRLRSPQKNVRPGLILQKKTDYTGLI